MRTVLTLAVAACLAVSSLVHPAIAAAQQDVTPRSLPLAQEIMAREAALWGAAKDRRFDDFRALLTPDYMAVYGSGRANADRDIAGTQRMSITDVRFDSVMVRSLDSSTVVDTYRVQLSARLGEHDISGLYWTSSTWHRDASGAWRLALHTETKAPK